ncbi:plancitoxin-1-like [Ptychodera flava]|uniref:plancitoxin-1-like n=1 Tax=Ptychodera flava TaxID=63121 RepID=UPI00396A1B04
MAHGSVAIFFVAFLTIAFCTLVSVNGFSCKNNDNQDVDWFIVYKLPKITHHEQKTVRDGRAFLYMDEREKVWDFKPEKSIDKNDHAVFFTLNQLYHNLPNDATYLLYSDSTPDGKKNKKKAHAKGILLFDRNALGFLMIHSVPKFPVSPNVRSQYSWASNADDNGQILFCKTYGDGNEGIMGRIMYRIYRYEAQIYDIQNPHNIEPRPLKRERDEVSVHIERPSKRQAFALEPVDEDHEEDGQFISFAKPRVVDSTVTIGTDIYTYLADRLKLRGVFVESWRNGAGGKFMSCHGKNRYTNEMYKVENIKELKFTIGIYNIQFTTTKDHSKWAVSQDQGKPWICIGDLNRFESQTRRGGGLACMQDETVWKQFNNSIHDVERVKIDEKHKCPPPTKK